MHKYDRPRIPFYIAPKHSSPLLHNYRLLNNIRNMSQTSQSSSQRARLVFQAQFLDAEHEEFTADTAPQLARRSTPFSSPPTTSPDHSTPALPIPPRLGELATPELEGVVANPEAYSERNSAHSSVHLFPPNPTPGFNLAEWLADVQRDQNVARATAANIQNFQEELQRGQDPALGQLAPIPDHLFVGIPIWDAERRQQILGGLEGRHATRHHHSSSDNTDDIPALEEGEIVEEPEVPPPRLRIHNESASTLPQYEARGPPLHAHPRPCHPPAKSHSRSKNSSDAQPRDGVHPGGLWVENLDSWRTNGSYPVTIPEPITGRHDRAPFIRYDLDAESPQIYATRGRNCREYRFPLKAKPVPYPRPRLTTRQQHLFDSGEEFTTSSTAPSNRKATSPSPPKYSATATRCTTSSLVRAAWCRQDRLSTTPSGQYEIRRTDSPLPTPTSESNPTSSRTQSEINS
jgi:hypothetical protein